MDWLRFPYVPTFTRAYDLSTRAHAPKRRLLVPPVQPLVRKAVRGEALRGGRLLRRGGATYGCGWR
jgi:hypothetical protein